MCCSSAMIFPFCPRMHSNSVNAGLEVTKNYPSPCWLISSKKYSVALSFVIAKTIKTARKIGIFSLQIKRIELVCYMNVLFPTKKTHGRRRWSNIPTTKMSHWDRSEFVLSSSYRRSYKMYFSNRSFTLKVWRIWLRYLSC